VQIAVRLNLLSGWASRAITLIRLDGYIGVPMIQLHFIGSANTFSLFQSSLQLNLLSKLSSERKPRLPFTKV
jgi:hypothetical protein